jgi:hypothetical protein
MAMDSGALDWFWFWFWFGLLVAIVVVRALAASSYSVSDLLYQPVHSRYWYIKSLGKISEIGNSTQLGCSSDRWDMQKQVAFLLRL